MNEEIDLKLMFAESGNIELRQIPFNHSGVQIYFNLHEDNQELVIAGIPSDVTHEDIVQIFEYLVEIANDHAIKKLFEEKKGN